MGHDLPALLPELGCRQASAAMPPNIALRSQSTLFTHLYICYTTTVKLAWAMTFPLVWVGLFTKGKCILLSDGLDFFYALVLEARVSLP